MPGQCLLIFILYSHCQWHPTPVLLLGKSHGWRSLVGCSPWGHWESDTTEWLHFHFSLSCIGEGNGNPLQCSCLENPRDGGAWWAAVYGVAQSWTGLKRLSSSSSLSSKTEGTERQSYPLLKYHYIVISEYLWVPDGRTEVLDIFQITWFKKNNNLKNLRHLARTMKRMCSQLAWTPPKSIFQLLSWINITPTVLKENLHSYEIN